MRETWRALLDLALPPVCAGCGEAVVDHEALCARCDGALVRDPLHPEAGSGGALAAGVAAVLYRGDAERWVHRFKYPRRGLAGLDPAPGAVLRALIHEAAARAPGPAPGCVVPVPLHPRRLRARGFNPATSLARWAARPLGVPVRPTLLRRVRDTPSQTGLNRRQRARNMRNAFCARPDLRLPNCIWLVDDVTTTGSTLGEAARALRRAGARRVVSVCVARTPES